MYVTHHSVIIEFQYTYNTVAQLFHVHIYKIVWQRACMLSFCDAWYE